MSLEPYFAAGREFVDSGRASLVIAGFVIGIAFAYMVGIIREPDEEE